MAPLLDPWRRDYISSSAMAVPAWFTQEHLWRIPRNTVQKRLRRQPRLWWSGTIRGAVMGFAARQPTDSELRRMQVWFASPWRAPSACPRVDLPAGMYSVPRAHRPCQSRGEFDGFYSSTSWRSISTKDLAAWAMTARKLPACGTAK